MHISIFGTISATASTPLLGPTFIQALLEAHFDKTEMCSRLRYFASIPHVWKDILQAGLKLMLSSAISRFNHYESGQI